MAISWRKAPEIRNRSGHLETLFLGALRNSSRNSGADHERPEFVYFTIIGDKISTDVPDSFSSDACGFEFRNGPFLASRNDARSHIGAVAEQRLE